MENLSIKNLETINGGDKQTCDIGMAITSTNINKNLVLNKLFSPFSALLKHILI